MSSRRLLVDKWILSIQNTDPSTNPAHSICLTLSRYVKHVLYPVHSFDQRNTMQNNKLNKV